MGKSESGITNNQVGKEMIVIHDTFYVFHMVSVAPLSLPPPSPPKQEVRLVHMQLNASVLSQISAVHCL